MNTTPTPRCDAFACVDGIQYNLQPRNGIPHWPTLARQLETELTSANEKLAAARADVRELEKWKESAISVMPDYQEIGKAMGLTLGASIHDKILPFIVEQKAKLAKFGDLEAQLENYKDQWKRHYAQLEEQLKADQQAWFNQHLNEEANDLRKELAAVRACFADASHADVNAYTKWQECERAAAAMRERLQDLVDDLLGISHGEPEVSICHAIKQIIHSTDAGLGWISPKEHARLLLHIAKLESPLANNPKPL